MQWLAFFVINLSGSHKLIGELDTCVQDLGQMQPGTALSLISEKKKHKKSSYKILVS